MAPRIPLFPSSLYGRAALILVVPIVTIQLLVSVAFIQRHFEGVTEQMSAGVVLELQLLLGVAADNPGRVDQVAQALGLTVHPADETPVKDSREFWDFSGRVVMRMLHDSLPDVRGVDLMRYHRQVLVRVGGPSGELDIIINRGRVSASNPHQLLVLMVLASILLTVIAYVFLRNQLRPIKRLADAAEAFGKGRILPYRPRGAAEVRAAGLAFLDMRARIERQIEQRTLMLSGVSHDLRTPITRMKLELAMLEPGPETTALQADLVSMERMLDGFLDFARGTSGEQPVACDPRSLAATAVAQARRAGIQVDLSEGPPVAPVRLRPDAVARALDNLINNAGRHACRAEVSVASDGQMLTFTVEDDGPGIPPDRRAEALRPFTRLDSARDPNKGGGVGLGLAIAADVAQSHGGTLRLQQSARLGGLRAELALAC